MPQLVLWNGRGSHFCPDYLGWRRASGFSSTARHSLVHFGNDFVLGQVSNGHILRSTDIIQQEIVPFWGPPGEEGAASQHSQFPQHPHSPTVQAPESWQGVRRLPNPLADSHVLERGFGDSLSIVTTWTGE